MFLLSAFNLLTINRLDVYIVNNCNRSDTIKLKDTLENVSERKGRGQVVQLIGKKK